MPRTRAQRWRETVNEGGWADLPGGLMAKVLELLQAAGRNEPQEGGFSQATATVRLVCAAWQGVHDATVTRLVLRRETTDQAMGMLVRRFPTVVSLEVKGGGGETAALTDQGMRAVSSLAALTFLDITWCRNVTDKGVRAVVRSCTALKSLNLTACTTVTDEGVRAVVSSCTALQSLNLFMCVNVTDEGVRAVSSCTALQSLNLSDCRQVTDEGVRAVSNCTALTELTLSYCSTS
jgi:bacterioferritin-associated ferredoxin